MFYMIYKTGQTTGYIDGFADSQEEAHVKIEAMRNGGSPYWENFVVVEAASNREALVKAGVQW